MYVLVYKDRVLVGPRDWNYGIFEDALGRLGINMYLPRTPPDSFPFVINDETRITNSVLTMPNYNQKIERTHGPYWDTTVDPIQGTYGVATLDVEFIRPKLKDMVAAERYRKENLGIKITIQNTEVSINTSRGNRDIFIQKYFLMTENETVKWKFPECWLTLTKQDLGQIVSAGARYIQDCFDWEASKNNEIAIAQTPADLDSIIITEPETTE
jgi:hypothetical protein